MSEFFDEFYYVFPFFDEKHDQEKCGEKRDWCTVVVGYAKQSQVCE